MSRNIRNDKKSLIPRIRDMAMETWTYISNDVWHDTRRNWKVNTIKTINLSVRCFLDGDLQSRACALTYRTLLAVVPALALIFAIGRGFGFQDVLERELIHYFPAQATALETAFGFVDSYLQQTSGGVFLGVGIVFLLWTLISLLSSVENAFNHIWQIPKGRTFWRKVSDYTTIFIILPVMMIMASGISLFMTTSLKSIFAPSLVQPALPILFDGIGLIITWLFFAGTYILIPNSKIKFKNAILAGVIVGTAYQILQWLFVSGQMYVAKYNAIYGSFSFLPLFMIWIQLVWLITLIGAVICYSSQNINEFNFGDNIRNISIRYRRQISVVVMTIVAQRFAKRLPALSLSEISQTYNIPINIVTPTVNRLYSVGLISYVLSSDKKDDTTRVQPAVDVSVLSVTDILQALDRAGDSHFIPNFSARYNEVLKIYDQISDAMEREGKEIKLTSIDID